MITKIDNHKIKHQLNTEIFLDHDNLIKSKMKSIMKLNSQLIHYLWMELEKNLLKKEKKKLNLPNP